MSRRRRERRLHSCSHRGFGEFCHRCAQAKALRRRAKTGSIAPEVSDALAAEAARLESTGRRT